MKLVVTVVTFMVNVILASHATAWSETGHIVIAELAASKLGNERYELNRIAGSLATQLDTEKRLYLIRNYKDISYLGQIASFPDSVRNLTVSELFSQYGETVPSALEKYADQDTSKWHYTNQPYIAHDYRQQCDVIDPVNLTTVIPDLVAAFSEATNDKDKAIVLAFIIHLVGDASQPLHTFTKVFYGCDHDRGGNDFCAADRAGDERCELTLHQLWDRALGYFDEAKTLENRVAELSAIGIDPVIAGQTSPDQWVAKGQRQARFIYALSVNEDPDPTYIEQGQLYSELYMAEAAAWLTNQLKALQ